MNHWYDPPTDSTRCGEYAEETARAVSVSEPEDVSCPDCHRMLLAGEVRVTSSTGGQKGTKAARFDLLPPEALAKVAELYGFGAQKYDAHNWRKGYAWSLSFASMMRHAWAFWNGEDIDAETGLPHLTSVVFHAFTLLTFMTEHRDFDDRFTPEA